MSFLQSIKAKLFDLSLSRRVGRRRAIPEKAVNLETAQTIGILFNATDLDQRKIVLDFVAKWSKQKKKFRLLGFFDSKLKDENFTFDHFNLNNINWLNIPNGEEIEAFLAEDFDLLIYLDTRSDIRMEYLSMLAVAPLKVGPPMEKLPAYDFMVEVSESAGLKQFIRQMENFLQKINTHPSHA